MEKDHLKEIVTQENSSNFLLRKNQTILYLNLIRNKKNGLKTNITFELQNKVQLNYKCYFSIAGFHRMPSKPKVPDSNEKFTPSSLMLSKCVVKPFQRQYNLHLNCPINLKSYQIVLSVIDQLNFDKVENKF